MSNSDLIQQAVEFIQSATNDVFGTMLGLEVQPGEVSIGHTAPSPSDGVVSLIGLTGVLAGMGSISCNAGMACRLSSALLMGEYNAVDDEVLDAVAEVTNMVIGNVKTMLEDKYGAMNLSIPTVIYGRNFATRSVGESNWTVVPFTCEGESFRVQICLVESAQQRPAARVGFTTPHALQSH